MSPMVSFKTAGVDGVEAGAARAELEDKFRRERPELYGKKSALPLETVPHIPKTIALQIQYEVWNGSKSGEKAASLTL